MLAYFGEARQISGHTTGQLECKTESSILSKPSNLLPSMTREPDHKCIQIIQEVYSSRPDLTDQPLENPDMEVSTAGRSFMDQRLQKARYAVVTHQEVLEAEPSLQVHLLRKKNS